MILESPDLFRRLQQRARDRKLNTQQQLELYVHERLLARVAASPYRKQLVLKGGMLLAALGVRDVTRDADMAATDISNDPDNMRRVAAEIARIDLNDGVTFDAAGITSVLMREEDDYHGLRIRIPCRLHTARLVAQIDVSFGDPLVGRPRQITTMLAGSGNDLGFTMLTYSVESVLAEKLVTMMSRGDANTRDRDFGDVWLIGQQFEIVGDELLADMQQTALHRQLDLAPLASVLIDLPGVRSRAWRQYRARTRLEMLPAEFEDVVAFAIRFADPLIANTAPGSRWLPNEQRWTAGVPD